MRKRLAVHVSETNPESVRDILYELVSMGDLPLSPATTASDLAPSGSAAADVSGHSALGHTIVGSTRLHRTSEQALSQVQTSEFACLPLHGILANADTIEMSTFAPMASSMHHPDFGPSSTAMDDLMAAFGFGSLVADQVPQIDGAPLQDVGSDSLYTSLGMK